MAWRRLRDVARMRITKVADGRPCRWVACVPSGLPVTLRHADMSRMSILRARLVIGVYRMIVRSARLAIGVLRVSR